MRLLQKDLTLDDITDDCWKVMTPRVTGLEFFWTDGLPLENPTDPEYESGKYKIKWYGGKDGNRKAVAADRSVEVGGKYNGIAVDMPEVPYRARWTNNNPQDWPKAVKMMVTFTDDTNKSFRYEIICPVGP